MAKKGSGTNDRTADDIFAGGGEMGARMRSYDWSQTPLGEVSAWRQSLKTAVRLMLNSRFSMFIWWGEELVYLYNDAYLPTLGIHHPHALGRPAPEVWSEVWQDIEPQVKQVTERGEATWNEELLLFLERRGFKEETYHTFSYSPIIEETGGIGGLFCAVSEETQKVLNRRRLQSLRDLGERTLAEAGTVKEACRAARRVLSENPFDVPFALIYLLDADGRHARLAETVRIDENQPGAPPSVEIGARSDIWEFHLTLGGDGGRRMPDIERKFGRISAGVWDDDQSREAFIVPLAKSGTQDFPAGFLVAGISPRLVFDADYQGFLELAAGHIATSIANAEALETERKRVESLAELDRAKTEFFSNVSHEFRTPLTLMLGNLEEVLRRDAGLPSTEREQLETAHRNSLRLLKLVNNLLDFSRLEAGRAEAHFEPTDLARLTAELASNFRSGTEKAGIELKVDCPELSETIAIDREMWEKIVLNLLSNAFKFTLRGEIEIALRETETGVELKVRDTGVGIPADELPKIFRRFHRVRAAEGRTHEGTGIGLSLVQELVNLLEGTIDVASEIGRGTTFTVAIPKRRKGDRETGRKRESAVETSETTEKSSNGWRSYVLDWAVDEISNPVNDSEASTLLPFYPAARVLLADDNADMRGYIARLLGQNGYTVETAADGREALEKLRAANASLPDLLLTDVMMPRLDGFELLEEIRRDARLREIPVIMLSARAGEESKIEGFEAGADDYLIKPFSARELLARVGSVIELAKMRRAVQFEQEKSFAVLESVTDAFYALDRDFRFTYLNGKAERYFGKSREELIGRHVLETFPAGFGTLFQTELEKAFRENAPVNFEILSPLSHRWIDVQAYPSRESLLVYFRDITERKKTEERLRASEERYRSIVSQSIAGIAEAAADGRFLTVNDRYCEITGYSRDELLNGMRMQDITHPDDLPGNLEFFQKCLSDGVSFEIEKRYVRKNGTPLWVHNSVSAVCGADGKPHSIVAVSIDVTERKRAEEALQKSAAEFRLLADAVPQILWVADARGKVIFVNQQWTNFSGLGIEETAQTANVAALYHPDERDQIFAAWARAIETGTAFETEARIRDHRTDDYRWFLMRSEPVEDETGKIFRWFGSSTDITASKTAENRAVLIAEINQLTRHFENPSNLLYVVSKIIGEHLRVRRCLFNEIDLETDTETVHRDYCRGVESVAGEHKISDYSAVTTAEMIAGRTVVNRDSKTDPRTAAFYEQTYAPSGERAYVAVPLLRESRWVASLWVSDDAPREWSKEDVNLLETIAEQVWSVVEKLRIDAALRESEKRFRNMADHAPVMVWVTDPTGYCHFLSQSWYEFTGQTPETGLGFGWLDATHPDDAPRAEEEFIRANEKREPFRFEYRLRRSNGEYRWAIDSAQPRFGANGEFLGYIGSVIDITERKEAEQERENLLMQEKFLRAEAEDANRLKDEFLATVSHELRTPLNSMLGWASMVRQNNYNPEIMRRAFEVVERNARNQNQIISDILDVSRIITGKLNLNLQPVALSSVISGAIDTLRPAIDAKGIRLEARLETDVEAVRGDADRLQQIIWNLLSNAVKFTPEGGHVEISLEYETDYAQIVVRDNGSGIEPEFLPFVFDRFRQADGKTNRRHGGLGLGLSIVRHLVELHGGSVFVASRGADQGAIFTVRFPLKARRAETGESASEADSGGAPATTNASPRGKLAGLKILVVDDEPDALDLAAFILSDQSAEVLTAPSTDAALEIFERENFDALVSDIGMPEKDGHELIREIKARTNGQKKAPASIALTAYAREEDSRLALEAGFDAYLPKPVEPAELIETVVEITKDAI